MVKFYISDDDFVCDLYPTLDGKSWGSSGARNVDNDKDLLTPYLKEIGINITKNPEYWNFSFPTEEDYHKMCFHFGDF